MKENTVEVGILKLLFPSGIPVESYPWVPDICRLAAEAQHVVVPAPEVEDPLSRWLSEATAHVPGSRTNARAFYEHYVAWCAQNAPEVLNNTPGCAYVIQKLGKLGVGSEHTPDGWCVIDRRFA
jgi:hypothetical protein